MLSTTANNLWAKNLHKSQLSAAYKVADILLTTAIAHYQ